MCVLAFSHSSPNNTLSKQVTAFIPLVEEEWRLSCHSDYCQTSESMLTDLGFQVTTAGLIVRVATEARLFDTNECRHTSIYAYLPLHETDKSISPQFSRCSSYVFDWCRIYGCLVLFLIMQVKVVFLKIHLQQRQQLLWKLRIYLQIYSGVSSMLKLLSQRVLGIWLTIVRRQPL